MAKRSYGQHCGLAIGLDVLAERWTLLVVRELLPGGRRFNELFDALPGVSTDLLTARLRSLEEIGAVERHVLRHPAKVTLYQLTPWGQELRPIVEQLARWGERLLPAPGHPDYALNHRSALGAAAMSYAGTLADGDYQLTLDDEDLTIHITDGSARFHYGPATGETQMHVEGSVEDFYRWVISGAADVAGGEFHAGNASMLAELLAFIPGPGEQTG